MVQHSTTLLSEYDGEQLEVLQAKHVCHMLTAFFAFRKEHRQRLGELHPRRGRFGQIWQQTEVSLFHFMSPVTLYA